MDKLLPDNKAKWFAGVVLNTADQAMASVLSAAMSRLNVFLNSERCRITIDMLQKAKKERRIEKTCATAELQTPNEKGRSPIRYV